VYNARQVW